MAVIFTGRSQDARVSSNKRCCSMPWNSLAGWTRQPSPPGRISRRSMATCDGLSSILRAAARRRAPMLDSLPGSSGLARCADGGNRAADREGIDYDISDIIRAPDQQWVPRDDYFGIRTRSRHGPLQRETIRRSTRPRHHRVTTIGVSGFADQDDPSPARHRHARGGLRPAGVAGPASARRRNRWLCRGQPAICQRLRSHVSRQQLTTCWQLSASTNATASSTRSSPVTSGSRRAVPRLQRARGKPAPVNTKTGGIPQELKRSIARWSAA